MLCVERSPLAPRRVYRALRSGKTRYDTNLDKGWANHITNIGPIQTVEPPSPSSPTGRVITISGDRMDDVDVSRCPPFHLLQELTRHRSSYLLRGFSSASNFAVRPILPSTKHPCLDTLLCLQMLLDHQVTWSPKRL